MKPVELSAAQAAKQVLAARFQGEVWLRGIGVCPLGRGFALRLNVDPATAPTDLPRAVDGVPVEVVKIAGYSAR